MQIEIHERDDRHVRFPFGINVSGRVQVLEAAGDWPIEFRGGRWKWIRARQIEAEDWTIGIVAQERIDDYFIRGIFHLFAA
jgi:hypothetical protein